MSQYEQVFDQATATSGGGTATTSKIDVSRYKKIAFQIVGDSNTSDIDIDVRGQTSPAAGLGEVEGASFTAQNLTIDSNNSKIYTYDVESLNSFEYIVTNNTGSNTTIDGYVTKTNI